LNMTAAQIQASPAPAWQKTIMTALSTYGAYIEDTDGNQAAGIDILTQAGSSWTDLGLPDPWLAVTRQFGSADGDLVSSVPISVSDLQVVKPCYPEGSCPTATAASTPRHRSTHRHKHKKRHRAGSKTRHHGHKRHRHRRRHAKHHH
jgi:hypothetical protein